MTLAIEAPERIAVEIVDVPDRFRLLNNEKVADLAKSMAEIGLMTPIHVRSVNDGEDVALVAGNHGLQAARLLGWEYITASFVEGDDDEFRLWEISENLHRSELTTLEHSEHVAEWVRLTNAKVGQVAHPLPGGQQPADKGMSAASRVLGLERTEVRPATKIDAISPEAKRAARDAGLDTNQPPFSGSPLLRKRIKYRRLIGSRRCRRRLGNPIVFKWPRLSPTSSRSCVVKLGV